MSLTTAARTDPWADLADSRALRVGLRGVLSLYSGVALLWVFCVPLFGPADERAHVDYAWQVAHGHLPVAGTWFTAEFPQLGQVDYVQHVSNHPPLWYLVAGPALRVADALGHPAVGLYALRLFNAALTFVTILVVARLAAEVAARASRGTRVAVVLGATLLVAVNPALIAASGAIQNDAPSILLAALVALVLARACRRGVDRRTVVVLAVLCTLGMLTRITFVNVVAVAVLATALITWWPELRPGRPDRAALRLGLLRGGAILAAVVAGAGWFVLLNLHRYGDPTGGSAVYQIEWVQERTLAPGAAHGPLVYLLHPNTWWTQAMQLAAPVPSIADDKLPYLLTTALLVLVVALAVVAAVRGRGRAEGRVLDRPGVAALLVLGLCFAGSMAELADHVTNRGGANQRYLLDALGFWTVGGAILLLALGRWAPAALGVVGGLGAMATACYAAGIALRTDDVIGGSNLHSLWEILTTGLVPAAPICVAALVLAGVGLTWTVSGLRQARETTEERSAS